MLVGFRCIYATKVSLFVYTTFEHDVVGKAFLFHMEVANFWFLTGPAPLLMFLRLL